MKDTDQIINFTAELGKEMLLCGSNLERVTLAMEVILKGYGLKNISVNALMNVISLGAMGDEEEFKLVQVTVPTAGLNLERLKSLNALSYKVRKTLPAPEKLDGMLKNALLTPTYTAWKVLLAFLLAMACLCRIFGGGWQEMIVIEVNTAILFGLSKVFGRMNLNKIISNGVSMFICSTIAFATVYTGIANNYFIIVITNAFYLVPGIQTVNAVRNILCGNERNGLIELFKIVLEIVTIVVGIAVSFYLFGEQLNMKLEDSMPTMPRELPYIIEIIVLSFFASFGFSVVFGIHGKDLILAGIGGMIIRIVLLVLTAYIPYRIAYMLLAAFPAALYAEILANIKRAPSTVYLYPSIVPLIPGDLVCYTALGIVWQNGEMFATNAPECMLALVGMSVGFVLCSTIMHYVRKIKFKKQHKYSKTIKTYGETK